MKLKNKLITIDEGKCIRVQLPEECGYIGYSVRCIYKYDKENHKCLLSMWLLRDDIEDGFKLDSQEIDTQYLSNAPTECFEYSIKHIIECASMSEYFEKYIKRFEYTYKCFDKGNEIFSNEELED